MANSLGCRFNDGLAVSHSAAVICAAYISASRVIEGSELQCMQRAVQEAFQIARLADDAIPSDMEMG